MKERKLLESFHGMQGMKGKVFWKFRAALTRIAWRGYTEVARGWVLRVQEWPREDSKSSAKRPG